MPLLQFARYREIAAELANSSDEAIVASGGLGSSILWRAAVLCGRPVSVRLSTLDAFARRVLNDCREYPRVATDPERLLAMRTAVAAIDDSMMETRGIAAMMERSYRDVRDSGITLDQFQRRAGNRGRAQILTRAWRAYEQLIAALPAVDPADLLERAAVLIGQTRVSVPQQIVAGFYDMTGAQLRLLSALDAAGKVSRVLVPIGEGSAYAFASRFVTSLCGQPRAAVLHIKSPKITVEPYATKESELRSVCAAIRDLLDAGTPANDIGIVARTLDPDDIRMLQRFAAELGFAITARNDVPLNAHRLGRGVSAVLRLRDRNFPRAEVIDILRDGYQLRQHANVDRLDIATRQIRMWRDEPALEDFKKVVAELESLAPVSRTLLGAGWAALLGRIAAKFRLDTELDLAAAAALDDIAALLGRWPHHVDLQTVLELIENCGLPHPPPATRYPLVWAGDVMKFRGRSFQHLFVIRAQETTLPQRRVDDPLLPDSERRQVGVREIGDGRDEERLLFQLLLDGASTSVRFSFAGSDTFGKILRPSRMLRPFGESKTCTIADNRPPITDNLNRQLQLLAQAGTRSSFDGYLDDEKIDALIANELQAISPTELENFGECPQKFFLKRVLRVIDYDDPDRELQMPAREKGKLDHTILERFYRSLDRFPPSDFRDRLGALVDQAFDEEEGRVPAFNRVMRGIERRATKRNLHAFLTEDIEDLVANGLRPAQFEYKFGPEPFLITEHDVPIMMKGVIDRIDEGAETLRIVDYKSGKALRHLNLSDKIDRGMRLQLALYAMAVAKFFNAPNVSGAIKPLMPGSKAEKFTFDLADAGPRLGETLDLFIASMLRGRFPAFPDEESCRYCPVNHSCRTRHSDAERHALEQFEDPRGLLESMA